MKHENKNKIILRMAILAMFIAIIAILTFVPYVGFIPLGFTSVTIIHVVVIIGAMLLGKYNGAILGLAMGVCSLLNSYAGTANDITFIYPWVSILPRVIFGFLAGFYYEKIKFFKNEILNICLIAILSTITHTILVYIVYLPTFTYLTAGYSFSTSFSGSIGGNNVTLPLAIYCIVSFMFSCLFESILAGIVTPPVIIALNKNKRINKNIMKMKG